MLDSIIRPFIDPPLNVAAKKLARLGISPNAMTSIGLGFAAICFLALVQQYYYLALTALIINRLCDGLDGPIARAYEDASKAHNKHFGAYYDIVSDFILYGGFPLFFALGEPSQLLPATVLLFSFILAGISFLGYAVIAEKLKLTTEAQGKKGFYYMAGLMEGTETITFFIVMALFPNLFGILAFIFSGLCILTMIGRLFIAHKEFK
jgi:phosphatidylglycerophosphate synthase